MPAFFFGLCHVSRSYNATMRDRVRMLLILLVILLTTLMGASGCSRQQAPVPPETAKKKILSPEVKTVLDNAERLELFSIGGFLADGSDSRDDTFRGWSKTEIDDKDERQELLEALYKGIDEATYGAICFEPAYGLRATSGEDTVELSICFECHQIEVSVRGNKEMIPTTDSPLETLNAALRRAGVPLP